ncbi:hypothetical protein ACTA71_004761 [Dictyostelium dimigraforme]
MISRLILNSRRINKNTIISNVAVSSLFKNNNIIKINNNNSNIYINKRSFCSGEPKGNDNTIETKDENKQVSSESKTSDLSYTYDEGSYEYYDNSDEYSEDLTEEIEEEEEEVVEEEEENEFDENGEERDFESEYDEIMEETEEGNSLSLKPEVNETPIWGADYHAPEGFDESDKFAFTPLPTDVPTLPTSKRAPTSVEELIIKYEDPFKDPSKTNANYFPYFRFTEPRGYTVESFLKKIGRGCDQHVELFEKWEDLMETNPRKLKDSQVPVQNRKWILHWVEQFKQGRDPVLISKSKSKAKSNKKK